MADELNVAARGLSERLEREVTTCVLARAGWRVREAWQAHRPRLASGATTRYELVAASAIATLPSLAGSVSLERHVVRGAPAGALIE